jgi:hypothetical protein
MHRVYEQCQFLKLNFMVFFVYLSCYQLCLLFSLVHIHSYMQLYLRVYSISLGLSESLRDEHYLLLMFMKKKQSIVCLLN